MRDIPETLFNTKSFIYKDNRYLPTFESRPLPTFEVKYKDFLASYDVGYNVRVNEDTGDTFLEIYDSKYFEFELLKLPVYVTIDNIEYTLSNTLRHFKSYSEETINAAWKLYGFLSKELPFYNDYCICKKALDGKTICVYEGIISDGYHNFNNEPKIFSYVINKFNMFAKSYSILVDTSRITDGEILDLAVPYNIAGTIIGKDACNLKDLSSKLNLRYIHVITY